MSTPVLTAQPLGHAASNCGEVWGIFGSVAAQCATGLNAPTRYQGKAMPSGRGHALNSLITAADKGIPSAMRINPTQFDPQQGFGNVSRWLRGHARMDKKRMDKIFKVLRLHQGVVAHWRRIFLESITFCHWHKSVAFA